MASGFYHFGIVLDDFNNESLPIEEQLALSVSFLYSILFCLRLLPD